jgi:hypothetical protein
LPSVVDDQKNSKESLLEEPKSSELSAKPQPSGVKVCILAPTMLGNDKNVVTIVTRGLWFGAESQAVESLVGPGCHGGHDESHRGFWAVFPGVILAELWRDSMAAVDHFVVAAVFSSPAGSVRHPPFSSVPLPLQAPHLLPHAI